MGGSTARLEEEVMEGGAWEDVGDLLLVAHGWRGVGTAEVPQLESVSGEQPCGREGEHEPRLEAAHGGIVPSRGNVERPANGMAKIGCDHAAACPKF